MSRFVRRTLDRPLAILVALAMAWFPANLRTNCGCDSCACQQSADESCCCEGASAATCHGETASQTCCDGARSVADRCGCEVHRSESPATRLVRDNQSGSPDAGIAGPIAYLARPQSDNSLVLDSARFAHSGPPLRVLYCVWRN